MPQPEGVDPSAYRAEGGPLGALLIHGYTGSAAETRPMGAYLAERGMTVRCPLLAGHGTRVDDLGRIKYKVWTDQVESALQDLNKQCETVFVGGLSLGSLLTLWLGSRHPEIAGLVPMAPAVQLQNPIAPLAVALRYVLKYDPFGGIGDDDLGTPEAIDRCWSYDELPLYGAGEVYLLQREVRRQLPNIRQPILIFQGKRDAQLTPRSAQIVNDRVGSPDKTVVWLENSGHNLLVDGEREAVWAESYEWMMARAASQGQ